MKKIINIMLIIAGAALIYSGCDKIDEPYLEKISGNGTGPVEGIRKVLLEEFTGHKCPNCPEAADLAADLKILYGEQLILLTIHAGNFATPDETGEFTDDFRTPEGNAINNYFLVYGYPSGLVDRKEFEGSKVLTIGKWQSAIADILEEPAQADLSFSTHFETSSRTLTCEIETNFLEDLPGTYNLCVSIVESGIVAPQLTETGVDTLYVHNHMFRGSLNGTWGEPVGVDGHAHVDHSSTNEYTIVLPSDWNVANCKVIAYIINSETYEVIQADETDIELP